MALAFEFGAVLGLFSMDESIFDLVYYEIGLPGWGYNLDPIGSFADYSTDYDSSTNHPITESTDNESSEYETTGMITEPVKVRRGFSPYSMLMKNQYFKRDLPGSHRVAKRASDSLADHDKNDIFYEMF